MVSCIVFFTIILPINAGESKITLNDTLQEVTVIDARINERQQSATAVHTTIGLRRIEQEQMTNYKDISAIVPNFYIPDYGSRMTSTIYVRGMGARIDNPVTGLYVDGIAVANKNAYDFSFADIRNIEFWSGPQGTLFGRNTIGGVMSISTLSALDWQGFRASVGYGNGNSGEAHAAYYHKFGKTNHVLTGVSAVVNYRHTDGFFTNTYDSSHADMADEGGIRLRFDNRFDNGTTCNVTAGYNFVKQNGFPYHRPNQPVNHNDYCGYIRHSAHAGVGYNIPLGDYRLSGSTAWQILADKMQMDQDYTPLPYFTLVQQQMYNHISQELTLTPKNAIVTGNGCTWKWLTGASLSFSNNDMTAPVHFMQTGIDSLILKNANNGMHSAGFADSIQLSLQEDNFFINSDFNTRQADVAVYHSSTFQLTPSLTLEAGLRLEYEYQHFNYLSDGMVHYTVEHVLTGYRPIHSRVQGKVSLPTFEALPRLAVSYNLPSKHSDVGQQSFKHRLFASIAEGYKAGGFNTQLFSDILQNTMMKDMMADIGVYFADGSEYTVADVITYKPERCLTSELSWVGTYRNDDMSLNSRATLYELEVFNQQLTVFPKRGTGRMMTNAGRSRSMGGEISAGLAWNNLSLNIAYGYTHASFVKYDNGKTNYAGKRVPYIPANTLNIAADYRFIFSHKFFQSLLLNVNTQAFGTIWWNEDNTEKQSFYALVNANITLQMKYISLTLWGKNLSNTEYDVFRFVSMGKTLMQSGKPITFGTKINIEI